MLWKDVRYEDDSSPGDTSVYDTVLNRVEFATEQYDLAVASYRANIKRRITALAVRHACHK